MVEREQSSKASRRGALRLPAVGLAILVLGMVASLLAQRAAATRTPVGPAGEALPVLSTVPAFSLVDQDGRSFDSGKLAGRPWILNFVYTTCGTVCPMTMSQLGQVRKSLQDESTIRTVTVTVDPDHDGPAVLKAYARSHGGTDPRWIYLTGDRRQIVALLQGLYLMPQGAQARLEPTLHSSRLILVDGRSRVRGYFESDRLADRERLVASARALLSEAAAR